MRKHLCLLPLTTILILVTLSGSFSSTSKSDMARNNGFTSPAGSYSIPIDVNQTSTNFSCSVGEALNFAYALNSTMRIMIEMRPSFPWADYDLYVKWDGTQPSLDDYDCIDPGGSGQPECCDSKRGLPIRTYYFMVYHSWGEGHFNISLKGLYTIRNLNTSLAYPTIQEAIDTPVTLGGHTIFVERGIYYEHVVVKKSLSLIGENRDTTIIDGNGTGTVVSLNTQNVSVKGFTIMNAGFQTPISGAILLNKTINCIIQNIATVDSDPCGIALFNSTYNNISRCESFNNTFLGLLLVNSNENTIVDNVISGHSYAGIGLGGPEGSSNNLLANNLIFGNLHGIDIVGFDNRVSSNRILNNSNGVLLDMANGNLVIANNISNNSGIGVYLIRGSEGNIFTENTIRESRSCGMYIEYGKSNLIYHNNFVSNHLQAYSGDLASVGNDWDDGLEGNYWNDYKGQDEDTDGLGDTEYTIYEYDRDNHPLMGMFSDFNATSEYHIQTICNSLILDFQFNGTAILFDVSGENDTSGFCRMLIPEALMKKTYRVFVNGTEVECTPLTVISNTTHNYIYFAYNHSVQEVVIIPESPAFLTPPLFMTATLFTVVVYKRKYSS